MKLVYGVGINNADYAVEVRENLGYVDGKQKQKLVWSCPFYVKWCNMLKRCYSVSYLNTKPSYKGCSVCAKWHLFSTFKAWMQTQDWEGKQLDKDLLHPGNKVYSHETCVFVSREVNMFLTDSASTRGIYLIGVSWNKPISKFTATCSNPFTKKKEHIGVFDSELEAHKAWLTRKLQHAYALAALQTDKRVAKALINRYTDYKINNKINLC